MKLRFSRQIIAKPSDIKFHENPSSGSRVITYVQTDMTNIIVAFHNYANARKRWPKNSSIVIINVVGVVVVVVVVVVAAVAVVVAAALAIVVVAVV